MELRDGWPRVMLDLGTSPVLLTTSMGANSRSPSLADDRWHRLDIMWGNEVRPDLEELQKVLTRCLTHCPQLTVPSNRITRSFDLFKLSFTIRIQKHLAVVLMPKEYDGYILT